MYNEYMCSAYLCVYCAVAGEVFKSFTQVKAVVQNN